MFESALFTSHSTSAQSRSGYSALSTLAKCLSCMLILFSTAAIHCCITAGKTRYLEAESAISIDSSARKDSSLALWSGHLLLSRRLAFPSSKRSH